MFDKLLADPNISDERKIALLHDVEFYFECFSRNVQFILHWPIFLLKISTENYRDLKSGTIKCTRYKIGD